MSGVTLGLGLQRLCVTLRLGFSPADIASMASAADTSGDGRMTVPQFTIAGVPEELSEQARNTSATGAASTKKIGSRRPDCAASVGTKIQRTVMCGDVDLAGLAGVKCLLINGLAIRAPSSIQNRHYWHVPQCTPRPRRFVSLSCSAGIFLACD